MIDQWRARKILENCATLGQAEAKLGRSGLTKAESWGLFDGFSGRPEATGGVLVGDLDEYAKAFDLGKRIKSEGGA